MRSFDKIIPQIIQTIEKYNLIQKGEHILIAVSGGCDSIALLHILYQLSTHYNLKLGVVHYEHGIRGEASLRDAEFVEEMTKKLNLPFI
ncbi:MAG: tRNA(Ile)-lysidine synthase [Candidatus Methanoperedenaceae archaeon GB37]|nr:MAG: tRNA(Ile)-lysidine synthase [Candidatus Methanoperedenaceae archaeon GB37]